MRILDKKITVRMMHGKLGELYNNAKKNGISISEFVRRAIDAYSHNVPPEQFILRYYPIPSADKDFEEKPMMPRTCLLKFNTERPEKADGRWKLLIVKDKNILGFRYEIGLWYNVYKRVYKWVSDGDNMKEIKGEVLGWADLP